MDYEAQIEKPHRGAAGCALICDLATAPSKRKLFDRLAKHLMVLADQFEMAMHTWRLMALGTQRTPSVRWLDRAVYCIGRRPALRTADIRSVGDPAVYPRAKWRPGLPRWGWFKLVMLWEKLERAKGLEPSTPTLARSCSTTELHPHPVSVARRAGNGCRMPKADGECNSYRRHQFAFGAPI